MLERLGSDQVGLTVPVGFGISRSQKSASNSVGSSPRVAAFSEQALVTGEDRRVTRRSPEATVGDFEAALTRID